MAICFCDGVDVDSACGKVCCTDAPVQYNYRDHSYFLLNDSLEKLRPKTLGALAWSEDVLESFFSSLGALRKRAFMC